MAGPRTPGASTPNHREPSDRVLEALDLRASGLQWDEIAERMGYADKSGPSNLVRRYLRTARQEAARYVMELNLHRLDRMLAAVWPLAITGDVQAQAAVIRIMDRQAKYLRIDGLGDAESPRAMMDLLDEMDGRAEPWGYHQSG